VGLLSVVLLAAAVAQLAQSKAMWAAIAALIFAVVVVVTYAIASWLLRSRFDRGARPVKGWALVLIMGGSTIAASVTPDGPWVVVVGAIIMGTFMGASTRSNERSYAVRLFDRR
jgi:hypothetical protein